MTYQNIIKKIWIMSGVGFRSKVVTEVTELQVFVDGYNRGTTKRSVEDYGGKFVRAFYVGDEMVGGYSLNQEQPFFHIDMIPTEELKSLPIQYSDIKITEIRSLWIKGKAPNLLRATVYCRSVLDAALTRPSYILGGTFTEKFRKVQMRALPNLLYFGDVNVWGRVQKWWIFFGTPFQCVIRLPYAVFGGWTDRVRTKR